GEANQVTFSEKPSIEELFFKKLFIYAGMYFVSWLTEDPDDDEDISIVCATLGFGAAGYNQHLIDTNSQ
ncbi:MAG: hypothetical protein KAR54_00300, partial [Candidatus Pacebacteria bacterium]|nr:hypothetical protein [Candidatus Paceibacterota bacterium]